jgi:hypothetical protein
VPATAALTCPNAFVFKSDEVTPEIARLVVVAVVEVRSGNVLIAVVEVAVKYSATAWPTTESLAYGEVVPMPTLPDVLIKNFDCAPYSGWVAP